MAHIDVYTKTDPDGTVYHFRDDRLPGGGGCMFPIGYIYMSVDSTDPGDIFGGTWEQIEDMFLLAAGTNHSAGSTGGAETVTLTADEIPAHTHGSKSLTGSLRLGAGRFGTTNTGSGIVGVHNEATTSYFSTSASSSVSNMTGFDVNATHEHTSVGGGGAHNNMPPYLAVYMWKRTA